MKRNITSRRYSKRVLLVHVEQLIGPALQWILPHLELRDLESLAIVSKCFRAWVQKLPIGATLLRELLSTADKSTAIKILYRTYRLELIGKPEFGQLLDQLHSRKEQKQFYLDYLASCGHNERLPVRVGRAKPLVMLFALLIKPLPKTLKVRCMNSLFDELDPQIILEQDALRALSIMRQWSNLGDSTINNLLAFLALRGWSLGFLEKARLILFKRAENTPLLWYVQEQFLGNLPIPSLEQWKKVETVLPEFTDTLAGDQLFLRRVVRHSGLEVLKMLCQRSETNMIHVAWCSKDNLPTEHYDALFDPDVLRRHIITSNWHWIDKDCRFWSWLLDRIQPTETELGFWFPRLSHIHATPSNLRGGVIVERGLLPSMITAYLKSPSFSSQRLSTVLQWVRQFCPQQFDNFAQNDWLSVLAGYAYQTLVGELFDSRRPPPAHLLTLQTDIDSKDPFELRYAIFKLI